MKVKYYLEHFASFFTLSLAAKKWLPLILVIFCVGFLVRVIPFVYFAYTDQSFFYDGDSQGYIGPAYNVLEGKGFAISSGPTLTPESFRTPGYPLFLILHIAAFGEVLPALFSQIVLTLVMGFIVLKISDAYFDIKSGIAAVAFFFIVPYSVLASFQFTTLTLFSFVIVLISWFWLRFLTTHKTSFLYVVAILLPIAAYVRPIALCIAVPFLFSLVFLWFQKSISLREVSRAAAIIVLVFIIGIAPWVLRNQIVFGHSGFSSIPGYQLYFFDDVSAAAIANQQSFAESRQIFEDSISRATGITYSDNRLQYIEFSPLTEVITREAIAYPLAHPLEFAVARIKHVHDFFVRDGLRYWLERLDKTSEYTSGFAIPLYEDVQFPYAAIGIFLERAFWYLVLLGYCVAAVHAFLNRNISTIFLVVLVGYFAFLSGAMSSAPFRYPIEIILLLLGITGMKDAWRLAYRLLGRLRLKFKI